MEKVLLNEIFKITKGKKVDSVLEKAESKSLRYIQIGDLRNDNLLKYTSDTNLVQVNENDVVIAWDGANAGTIGFRLNGVIGSTLARLSIKEKFLNRCNSIYLGYFLSTKFDYLQNTASGATIPHISKSALESIEIHLPDLETQNKIVAILDKAKTLLDKREATIKKYDELLRATSLEMFGNPMERPNRWSLGLIRDNIIDITAGVSHGGEDKKKLSDDEIGVLKISSVTKGILDPLEYKAVKKDLITKDVVNPLKGDLLFSRANTLELVGATCIVHENYTDLILPDKLWKIETDVKKLRKVYLHFVLKNKDVRKSFLSIATGSSGSMLNISMEKFKSIEIPLPPIDLQLRFETLYLKYSSIRGKLLKHCEFINVLNKSLSKLAFTGELKIEGGIELEVLLDKDYNFFLENIKNISVKTIGQLINRMDKSDFNENSFYEQ